MVLSYQIDRLIDDFAVGKIIRYVVMLYRFARESHEFMSGSFRSIDASGGADAESLRTACKRIVILAMTSLAIGWIAVPVAAPLLGVWKYGIRLDDAGHRMVMGFIFSTISIPAHLYGGVALGCLIAPRSFLHSFVGEQWLELIGVSTQRAAIVVCALVCVAVVVFWVLLSWLLISMAPFTN